MVRITQTTSKKGPIMSDMIETCRREEVPCGNMDCRFYDEKAEQYCCGDNDGWPLVATCTKYSPKMRNITCEHCGYESEIDLGVINYFCRLCARITVTD